MRYYLGTYDSADLAALAYDVAGWSLGVPREQLNDPSITCLQDAMFIASLMPSKVKTRLVKKEERARVLETDEESMARLAREHPEYVQYEQEFFWKREREKKKKVNDEAGPSTVNVIELSSSSSFDWNKSSSSFDSFD